MKIYVSPSGDQFVESNDCPEGYLSAQEYHNRFYPAMRTLTMGEILSIYEPTAVMALLLRLWHKNVDGGYNAFVSDVRRYIPGFGIRTAYSARQRLDRELARIGERLPHMLANRERMIDTNALKAVLKELNGD